MKKLIISISFIFSFSYSFSQIQQGDLQLSFTGNYSKTTSQSGVIYNGDIAQTKNLNTGLSFGYFVQNNLVFGVGLDYGWQNEVKNGSLFLVDLVNQLSTSTTKTHVIAPYLFGEMYFPVVNRLYFSTNLKAGFGFVNSKYDSKVANVSNPIIPNTITISNLSETKLSQISGESSSEFLGLKLSPKITYYLTDNFGVNLTMGGIEYNVIDWSLKNSAFLANFNPQFWELGINLKF